MTEPQLAQLWTPDDLAERLQLSRAHIYRLCAAHRLPFLRVGNSIRFRPADIEAWLEAKMQKAVK